MLHLRVLGFLALFFHDILVAQARDFLRFLLLQIDDGCRVRRDEQLGRADLEEQPGKRTEVFGQMFAHRGVGLHDDFAHRQIAFPRPKLFLVGKERVEAVHHRGVERRHERRMEKIDDTRH